MRFRGIEAGSRTESAGCNALEFIATAATLHRPKTTSPATPAGNEETALTVPTLIVSSEPEHRPAGSVDPRSGIRRGEAAQPDDRASVGRRSDRRT